MHCIIKNPHDVIQLFPTTTTEIAQRLNRAKEKTDETVQAIIKQPADQQTFASTFGALDKLSYELSALINPVVILEHVSPDATIREASHHAVIEFDSYVTDHLKTNKDLYEALKAYAEHNAQKESLSDEKRYFIQTTLEDYERLGLNLDNEKREKIRALLQELVKISAEFSKNINDENRYFLASVEELVGVPNSVVAALEKEGDRYKIKTDYPTAFGILDNCTVQATREKMFKLFSNRAYPANVPLLNDLIQKRDELAQLLGFASYAALDLDDQMAKNPETAQQFLEEIKQKAKAKAQQEVRDFISIVQEKDVLTADGRIKPWNIRYIKNQYKKKALALDEAELMSYFPLTHVIPQLLAIYEEFFSIKFKEVSAQGLWHADAQLLEVLDKNDKLFAYIILDLFPRDNKYSHAANFSLVPPLNGCPGATFVVANFPKPTGDTPALLRFDDVNTFFHEFGHALHDILSKTELASFAGTSVKRDFVEMPSQMLENWLKDKTILSRIGKHYKTGEPIPATLQETLKKLEQFDAGDFVVRQLTFAFQSLAFFDQGASKDTQSLVKKIHDDVRSYIAWDDNDHTQYSFGHLTGYGAKYYGYLWSKVFAADLFDTIKKEGLLNPAMGDRYKSSILSRGGSKDPNLLIEDFLGRQPTPEPFFRDMGF